MEEDNPTSSMPPQEGGDNREASQPGFSSAAVASFDPKLMVDFVTQLLPLTLGASAEDIQTSLLQNDETFETCGKFASDPQVPVLYAQKEKTSLEPNGEL
ncbi:dynein heavy chain [Entomophthora muscae]|uniref:Dynein heavy chain n=1 Tax=Entomophthora muscae TaxID=34485 RepID=A0ACC2RT41_9FUNG|nr:dynein heavy chain [Entomophthora muscae]